MATGSHTARRTAAKRELDAIAELLPEQGDWSEEAYLWLTNQTNRLIEFTDGRIEVLPMPTEKHQAILKYLFLAFYSFVEPLGGTVFFAALRLRLKTGKFREPDLLLLRSADDPRRGNAYWTGADLVLEVVSPDDPNRDLVKKRKEYAQAGIPEYWIVNPQTEMITVLRLEGAKYAEHGLFGRGATAASALLAGFSVSVDAVCDAA
ncbi:MAG TPA: Uma2 family endonuclease [Roseiflexaceae bacterium]|jgi:Uma2 family endonuclease